MIDVDRERRRAEALRANLRRRKAQARAQDGAPPGDAVAGERSDEGPAPASDRSPS